MKNISLYAAILVVLSLFIIPTVKAEPSPAVFHPNGVGMFYSDLSPYGNWLEVDGIVVWQPAAMQRGWAPYREGRWLWTADGWYWDSYEAFGYVTYHYGRWYFDNYYGWIWIPDDQWAPAWVEWRYDDDYVGWAPLPPYAVFSINIGIHFTRNYYTPYSHWHFVHYNRFCDPYVYNYYVPSKVKYRVYNHTKYRTNYGYSNGRVVNRGVDVNVVRKRGGAVKERQLQYVNNPRDLRNNSSGNRNDRDKIRTYVASRENFAKADENTRELNIKRSDRKSTLDVSKIEIGRVRDDRINSNKEIKVDRKSERELQLQKNRTEIQNNNGRGLDRIEQNRNGKSSIQNMREKSTSSGNEVRQPTDNRREVNASKRNEIKRNTVNEQKRVEMKSVPAPDKKRETYSAPNRNVAPTRPAPSSTRTEVRKAPQRESRPTPKVERSAPTRENRSNTSRNNDDRRRR